MNMEAQNDEDSNVDIVEVRKVLEDANMSEPNMTKDLMMSYYKALKNSKSTASEEDQTRRLNQTQEELEALEDIENIENTPVQIKEKPFTAKVWTSEKKLPLESALERNNNDNLLEDILGEIVNDSLKDATKTTFGFNEMVKDSEHTLSIITHELKFIPIQSSDKFLTAGTALKARLLYAYHTKVNRMKTELARLSFYPAPLPKVTSTSETFSSFSDSDLPETYVCRSGRQTKRKIYNYDDDDDSRDGISNKKVKNSEEQEWLSKPTQNKPSVRAQKKQETSKVVTELNKTEPEIADTSKEKKTVSKKEVRPLSRKLSNAEIVKRSSIFSDSPKRRCETMFDKLKEEEIKKGKEERTMELFNKTLQKLDEENNEASFNDDIITLDDEEQVKIRVIPPNPGRKSINRKRNNPEGLTPLDIKINSPTQKNKPPIEQNSSSKGKEEFVSKSVIKKRPPIRKSSTVESTDSVPSTSRPSKTSVICPICSGSFEDDKIEEHAATCGDDVTPRPNSKLRITCEICDKVVDFDTNYEVHVKECILKSKDKD